MFGIQWDLVLKHLSNKGVADSLLKDDSIDWGNYINKTYEITNTSVKYSTDYGYSFTNAPYNKTVSGNVLLTTGAHDNFSKYNIFDLAGNVFEWTLERSSYTSSLCTIRGGGVSGTGSNVPASCNGDGYPMYSYYDIGFRCSLY